MATPITDYLKEIEAKFGELFQEKALIIRSPGRINLIGEHTDYNMGFVLPASIDRAIYLGISKRKDPEIHLYSLDYEDEYQTTIGQITPSGKLWPDYILGVAAQLLQAGSKNITGFNIVFGGDIPAGAGLSSSAALECAAASGLNEIFGLGLQKIDLVRISQAAENQFVGVQCGIMDQFASVFGKNGQLIRLDCRNLDYDYIPFHNADVKVVLFDTRVKHSLASSAYNERRQQCEEGVRLIRAVHPEVTSLRDASEEMLLKIVKSVNEIVYKRCSYVVAENERLLAGCRDLENNDFDSFGERMFQTHAGLRDLYEVSCKELDILVDLARDDKDVLGARMMGGGFGGCTINLVRQNAAERLIDSVSKAYKTHTGTDVLVYETSIGNGTDILR